MKHEIIRFSVRIAIPVEEQAEINAYFEANPQLKRGVTIGRWLLDGVRREKQKKEEKSA